MIRHAAVAVAALCLFPAALHAQVQSTVTAASADVRSAPSIVNPVIGRAARGTALEITRDIGDWYKIAWPAARDGVGYVRRSDVSRAPGGTGTTGLTANGRPTEGERAGSRAASPSMSAEKRAVLSDLAIERQPSAVRAANLAAPSHVLGVGGLMDGRLPAPSFGFGISGRAWPSDRIGLQIAIERHHLTSTAMPGRAGTTRIAPSVLLALPGHLSEGVWFRPYVGAGGHLTRSTLAGGIAGTSASASAFGLQAFGGGELTLAGAPRLAVSADVGYRWSRTAFAGFDPARIGVSIGAHWYIR